MKAHNCAVSRDSLIIGIFQNYFRMECYNDFSQKRSKLKYRGIFMHILLFDDNMQSRQELRSLLLRNKAVTVIDCPETREDLLREHLREPADLVFIRLGNTHFNGLKLAKDLLAADARAKVIFISKSRDYACLAFDAGAADFLLEPVDEKALNDTIFRLCKNQT